MPPGGRSDSDPATADRQLVIEDDDALLEPSASMVAASLERMPGPK
jgi:hypothetical protein